MNRNINATEHLNYPSLETGIPLFSLNQAMQRTLQFFERAFAAAGQYYVDNPAVTQHSRLSMNPWEHRATRHASNTPESSMDECCPPLSS